MNVNAPQTQHIAIFETTLRDGEQSPGARMNPKEKLRLAEMLLALQVDVIEAGFPVSSQSDFDGVRAVAELVGDRATVTALARCVELDIVRAAEALKDAARPRIHVFCATSKIHLQYKLRITTEEVIARTRKYVALAVSLLDGRGEVEFSAEDASRTELSVLVEVVRAAIQAGATIINLPDTVGYSMPQEYGAMFANLRRELPIIDERGIVLSAHCHNDLGLAIANSLAAVENGARQVEVTLAGIGERAGNTQLETFVMLLKTRTDFTTNMRTELFVPAVNLLGKVTGLDFSRSMPVTGRNAFAHEAGIHQHGALAAAETYEIMRPQDVGWDYTGLVLGSHSGKAGISSRLASRNISLSAEELDELYERFMEIASAKKGEMFDADLLTILAVMRGEPVAEGWRIENYRLLDSTELDKTAEVSLRGPDDLVHQMASTGDGPLHAMFSAISQLVGLSGHELDYLKVHSVTRGDDALAEATVELKHAGQRYRGLAAHPDLLLACLMAYLHAANRVLTEVQTEVVDAAH